VFNLNGKNILVTGGSGFLGKKLLERLIHYDCNITVVARDEGKLIETIQNHKDVKIITGDISDPFVVRQCFNNKIDCVFHLAAFKHVGIAETQTRECVKSNVIGTLNLLEQSIDENLEFFLNVSTDKAAIVSGMYGATKFLAEGLVRQFETLNKDTAYRTVRYGNVLYSTGSVLCKWKRIIEEGGEVIITDPEATRFFWTIDQAVDLLFECLEKAENSDPWVPDMKSMKMGDLLKAMIAKYSNGNSVSVKEIGLQQGENKHEKIFSDGLSSEDAEKFTIQEITELI
jgi:UDP-N-acetylglucosamine 4,6-dehydratase/UDP-glucose 4-epimerase